MGRPMGTYDKTSQVRSMSDDQAAYVGAMLDGEGWVRFTHDRYPDIRIGNTNPEIISAILRATGCGYIDCKTRNGSLGTKPMFAWRINRILNAETLCIQIAPYSEKAQRVLRVIYGDESPYPNN